MVRPTKCQVMASYGCFSNHATRKSYASHVGSIAVSKPNLMFRDEKSLKKSFPGLEAQRLHLPSIPLDPSLVGCTAEMADCKEACCVGIDSVAA